MVLIFDVKTQLSTWAGKVEKILKGSLNSIPSPSPSVKIQIMCGKVCLRCKGKTLLGIVNKLFIFKSLLTTPSNVLPSHLKQTFQPIIWIFNEGEGDANGFRLPFKIFSTLTGNSISFHFSGLKFPIENLKNGSLWEYII